MIGSDIIHFTLIQILLMIPTGILAGIVSSTVGMASLISYPGLIYLGGITNPVFANVTNTASMIFSGLGSGLSSLPELRGHLKQAISTLLLTFFGSIIGTFLLLEEPSSSFQKIVPFFIVMAGIMILWPQKTKSVTNQLHHFKLRYQILAAVAILIMGGYMGYFGAGAGVIMIAILSRITNEKYPVYNAVRNVSALSANLVAMVIYAIRSHVYWIMVVPLGIGLFIGGYIGPKLVRRIPEKVLKTTVGILAFVLAIVLFVQGYMK